MQLLKSIWVAFWALVVATIAVTIGFFSSIILTILGFVVMFGLAVLFVAYLIYEGASEKT